jgi:hypothetical protein
MDNECLRTSYAVRLLPLLLLLTLPAAVQAQFTSTTVNGTIIITGYTYFGNWPGSVTVPSTINGLPVTRIGSWAFTGLGCSSLANITIPSSVTNIGIYVFAGCTSLKAVYFEGNAPYAEWIIPGQDTMFSGDNYVTVYRLLGTRDWGATYGGVPTVNLFGFTITGTNGLTIVVEACTNLVNPTWSSLQSITLTSDNFCFTDPQWTNYSSRFYRLRSP